MDDGRSSGGGEANESSSEGFFAADPRLWGVGALYAALLMMVSRNGAFMVVLGVADSVSVLRIAAYLALAFGVLAVAWFARRQALCSHQVPTVRKGAWAAGLSCMAVGAFPALLGRGLLLGVGGALIAAGAMVHVVCWAAVFAMRTPQDILGNTVVSAALASVCAALAALVAQALGPGGAIACFLALVMVQAAVLYPQAVRLDMSDNPHAEPVALGSAAHLLWRVLWRTILAAAICVFIVGLGWDPIPSSTDPVSPELSLAQVVLGAATSTALVLLLLRRSPKSFTLYTLDEVLLPATLVVLMVIPFFATDHPVFQMAVPVACEASFLLVTTAFWCSACAALKTTDLAMSAYLPAIIALLAACLLAGLSLIWVVGVAGRDLCLAIMVAYVLALIVATARDGERRNQREIEQQAADRWIDVRAERLAGQAGLSARETEVLGYLCRGYSQVTIAKELYLSENTVRTHAKRIYAKVGVHSREELLKLVNE